MDNCGREWYVNLGWKYDGSLCFFGESWENMLQYFNAKNGDLFFFSMLPMSKSMYVRKFNADGVLYRVEALQDCAQHTHNYGQFGVYFQIKNLFLF